MNQLEATRHFISKALLLLEEHANEAQVRDNFTSFLRNMFPDNPKWVNDHVQGAETHVHLIRNNRQINGFIDNCIDSIAIEYEKNLNIQSVREEGFRQVKEYCSALVRENIPTEMILGILSDTVHWYVYEIVPDDNLSLDEYNQDNIKLLEVASLNINDCSERNCKDLLLFLQKYLGRQGGRKITAKRLADDFGLKSIYSDSYRSSIRDFVTKKIDDNPSYYKVIEDLWNKLVESHNIESENINTYISEYYISIIGKILCANLISKEALSSDDSELCSIVNGEFFENMNIENFVDYDYFGWLNDDVESIIPIIRQIQDDLKVYDFQLLPEEDMFGELMVQLANRTQRILLGQELTPIWLARQLVLNVMNLLPDGEYPQFVDMCCGSGSMIVETIKNTESLIPPTTSIIEKSQILQNCISGFDIDPLAVILAKINWLINIYHLVNPDISIFIPIYHADSLFAESLMTSKIQSNNEEKVLLQLFDKTIVMPSYAVSSDESNIFDTIVNKCYDCIEYEIEHTKFISIITEVLEPIVNEEIKLKDLCEFSYELYKSLYHLNKEGKNGIWAFILKNSFRPSLISAKFNGIVSNTPWLAMSKIGSNPYKFSLKNIAAKLGIKPSDSSFPHLEMATVFLLSSVNRFLKEGGVFGCILPDSVLTGSQHNKFRNGNFKNNNIEASFIEIWELPTNTFKNRGIAVFGKKEAFKDEVSYSGRHYESKDTYINSVFNVSKHSSKIVWTTDNTEQCMIEDERYNFKQGADVMPRCFFFFTNHASKNNVQISSIKNDEDYSYFLKDMKIGRNLDFSCKSVPKTLFKHVLVSNVLTPFSISAIPLALLPIKKVNGVWEELGESDCLQFKRPVLNLLKSIKTQYRSIKQKSDMYGATLNYRNKLVQQIFHDGKYLVVYGAGGANICASYKQINKSDDIIVDQTLYWTVVDTEDEALYLSSILNCPTLNDTITSYQPQGIFGKRHVHTLPLEYIPRYDAKNDNHIALIKCARDLVSDLKSSTDKEWLNPNKGTLSQRRIKIVNTMKTRPLYGLYVSLCEKILKCVASENDDLIDDSTTTNNVGLNIYQEYHEGYIPLYTLRAACGYFIDSEEPQVEGWIDASGCGFTPNKDHHFVVHAKGDSMLEKIKDGDLCVFEWYNGGSREGEIVLTQCSETDEAYGGKYTIKKYHSEKSENEEGSWHHTKIELQPLNPDYQPIELDSTEDYKTVGVFKCVL